MQDNHSKYMQRCLELAALGRYLTAPNPRVGAVLVHENQIVAEGYHQKYGSAHAEKSAIDNLQDKKLLSECTLYVNLEPCSHFGKTPPCADLILESKIPKVVIGTRDTSDKVAGKGIAKLKQNGIEVLEDVLSKECRLLNKRFFTYHEKKRPYIILKWAQTGDGFIADADLKSKWISCEQSRELVHEWRAEESAILVGTNTARQDNPHLTARPKNLTVEQYNQPLRIVIDRNLTLSKLNLYDDSAKTLIVNAVKSGLSGMHEFLQVNFEGDLYTQVCNALHSKQITSVIVEGGAVVLNALITEGLYDEARVFKSNKIFGGGIKAPEMKSTVLSRETIGTDVLKSYINHSF